MSFRENKDLEANQTGSLIRMRSVEMLECMYPYIPTVRKRQGRTKKINKILDGLTCWLRALRATSMRSHLLAHSFFFNP